MDKDIFELYRKPVFNEGVQLPFFNDSQNGTGFLKSLVRVAFPIIRDYIADRLR